MAAKKRKKAGARKTARKAPSRARKPKAAIPAAEAGPLTLTTDQGEVARIHDDPRLQQAAMAWSYRVRNRIRWNSSERSRRSQAQQARRFLEELGLSSSQLEQLASSGILELTIPFATEEAGWSQRIMPWEYLLSSATRELRTAPLTIVRHLDVAGPPPANRSGGRVAIVSSAPGAIGEVYDLSGDEQLARRRLKLTSSRAKLLANPRLGDLRRSLRSLSPDVVHVAGVDTHQGAELLEWTDVEKLKDGMLLADENGEPEIVEAEPLAEALTAGRQPPSLVVFNLYHSAARTAALTVASGAGAALGFQDTFDDRAALLFIGDFYRAWHTTKGDALVAFQAGWQALRDFPEPLTGTGVVLWSARSLVRTTTAEAVEQEAKASHRATAAARDRLVEFKSEREARTGIEVDCVPLDRLNYSLLHNRRPLFSRFELRKKVERDGHVPNVRIEVELATGGAPAVYRSAETLGDEGLAMTDRVFLPLTSNLARSLEESLHTALRVRVSAASHDVFEKAFQVTLVPVNEWVDDDENRQFLPSFVWPLDPAVRSVIASAQPYLHALTDDPSAGFDGYQCVDWESEDPTAGVDHQVAAIWRSLLDRNLGYINPPPAYTLLSQRLRTPSRILEGGRGTCIDLALLLAACLEYIDVYPVIFLLQGHAFPGYWRSEEEWETFVKLGENFQPPAEAPGAGRRLPADLGRSVWMFPQTTSSAVRRSVYTLLRQQVEEGHLVPLESVWLTTRSGFGEAQDDGWDNLSDPSEFHSMIDLRSARTATQPVTPLPLSSVLA